MPPVPCIPQVDLSRRECRDTYNRIKELHAARQRHADRLQSATSYEERQEILRIIEGLDEAIQFWREELYTQGCYVSTVPLIPLVQVVGVEATQSTQYFSVEGSGAAADNSVWLIADKPLLIRVYVENRMLDPSTVTGRLAVMAFNDNTLKYDIFRRHVDPIQAVTMQPSSRSRRRDLAETLNFLVPAGDCYGKVSFNPLVWVPGHESDPYYKDDGVLTATFESSQTPIIHCFRIDLWRTIPSMPTPTQIAAPSDAACRTTMGLSERMFPVDDLDIRDRGTRRYPRTGGALLQSFADYAAVRADVQTVRDLTTPTPDDHEIYVAMLPVHPATAPAPFGQGMNGSIVSVVNDQELFSHELGHLLLPGDDHVSDMACTVPNFAMTEIDTNYPDYPNATQRAGIGEWGVDLGPSPPVLRGPETPDIMSYCGAPRWISPYNYLRAFNGAVLQERLDVQAFPAEAEKLLLAFRLHRDGSAEFQWALHVPGEPRRYPGKEAAGIILELYDTDDALLASAECQRGPDRPTTAPYEDFREVLPWYENLAYVLVLRDHHEVARWPVEDAPTESLVGDLTMTERRRSDGGSYVSITWEEGETEAELHRMLRFTPDDGRTWIPLASGFGKAEVDVDSQLLRGIESCRFQLAVSTGFRTTVVESADTVAGPPLPREVTISEPRAEARVVRGYPLWLVGATTTRLDGREDSVSAFWSSSRDGFLGDGLRVLASGLSAGRHVLRLAVDDGSGRELTASVVVSVEEQSGEPR